MTNIMPHTPAPVHASCKAVIYELKSQTILTVWPVISVSGTNARTSAESFQVTIPSEFSDAHSDLFVVQPGIKSTQMLDGAYGIAVVTDGGSGTVQLDRGNSTSEPFTQVFANGVFWESDTVVGSGQMTLQCEGLETALALIEYEFTLEGGESIDLVTATIFAVSTNTEIPVDGVIFFPEYGDYTRTLMGTATGTATAPEYILSAENSGNAEQDRFRFQGSVWGVAELMMDNAPFDKMITWRWELFFDGAQLTRVLVFFNEPTIEDNSYDLLFPLSHPSTCQVRRILTSGRNVAARVRTQYTVSFVNEDGFNIQVVAPFEHETIGLDPRYPNYLTRATLPNFASVEQVGQMTQRYARFSAGPHLSLVVELNHSTFQQVALNERNIYGGLWSPTMGQSVVGHAFHISHGYPLEGRNFNDVRWIAESESWSVNDGEFKKTVRLIAIVDDQ